MEIILETKNLSKHYGRIKAVDNLNLQIGKGMVFGLLGPNGSGKTTTLGMVLDVINKTAGNYYWFGEQPTKEHRKRIGAILETPVFYPYLSGARNLELVCDIKGVSYKRIAAVLDQVGLTDRENDKFKTYSLGMKQRLSIASALLSDPEVMILDEPTNGLDPQGIAAIRDLISQIAATGKTILLASHLLDEVQKVCSHFAVLKNGRLIHSGPVAEVGQGQVQVEVMANRDLRELLTALEWVNALRKEGSKYVATLQDGHTAADLNTYLYEQGVLVHHLVTVVKSLEKQFLEILNQSS
ncbi:MAG TPA: ATP-binding cassette domain-containing protein [Flammeovirgaceae bacterium]|nr:ATP-binding cassette domain-containing protein [Flammeovirgaceae bacterium]